MLTIDIQNALKDLLGGTTIKEMMEVEMDDHLAYQKIAILKIQWRKRSLSGDVGVDQNRP